MGRIERLKGEVERRGYKWVGLEPESKDGVLGVNGHVGGGGGGEEEEDEEEDEEDEEEEGQEEDNSAARGGSTGTDAANTRPGSHGGRIGDEELRRLVEERLHEDDNDDGGLDL